MKPWLIRLILSPLALLLWLRWWRYKSQPFGVDGCGDDPGENIRGRCVQMVEE